MNDLLQLNRSIAEHWLGKLDAGQEDYLGHMPVCLGRLPFSAAELSNAMSVAKRVRNDTLRVLKLNRRYLLFARLAAKDVAAGKLDRLIKLGITLEQAAFLSSLTNDEVALLALIWQGPIVQFSGQSFKRGAAMQVGAAKHHAIAFIATRPQ